MFDRMPLFPPPSSAECMRVPLFGRGAAGAGCGCEQVVRIYNPACPEEYVDVLLSVDECGSLMVCLRRPQKPCCPPPRPCCPPPRPMGCMPKRRCRDGCGPRVSWW